ncbi:MAG: hypothetical protein ACN2B6_12740 [Rickettsiales bacterium]
MDEASRPLAVKSSCLLILLLIIIELHDFLNPYENISIFEMFSVLMYLFFVALQFLFISAVWFGLKWGRTGLLVLFLITTIPQLVEIAYPYESLFQNLSKFPQELLNIFVWVCLFIILWMSSVSKWFDYNKTERSVKLEQIGKVFICLIFSFLAISIYYIYGLPLIEAIGESLTSTGGAYYRESLERLQYVSYLTITMIPATILIGVFLFLPSSGYYSKNLIFIFCIANFIFSYVFFINQPSVIMTIFQKAMKVDHDLRPYMDCIDEPCATFDYTFGFPEADLSSSSSEQQRKTAVSKQFSRSKDQNRIYLQTGRFQELDTYLHRAEKAFSNGELSEYYYRNVIYSIPDESYDKKYIQSWIEITDSEYANYAYGKAIIREAWRKRGNKFAQNTAGKDLEAFDSLIPEAYPYFVRAFEKNPHSSISYTGIFELFRVSSQFDDEHQLWIDRLHQYIPTHFYPRYKYMNALVPRWGGDYQSMRTFALQEQTYVKENPRIRALLGYEWAERARDLENDGYKKESMEYYERALYHGKLGSWSEKVAYLAWQEKDFSKVEKYLRLTMKLSPNSWRYQLEIATALKMQERYGEAEKLYSETLAQHNDSDYGWYEWGRMSFHLKNFEAAEQQFANAYKVNPNRAEYLYWQGLSLLNLDSLESETAFARYIQMCNTNTASCDPAKVEWAKNWQRCMKSSIGCKIDGKYYQEIKALKVNQG